MLLVILLHLAAFFIGSIPFGYLLAKLKGVDIRSHGSGNIGATNVGRTLGKKAGILTLILDMAKGAAGSGLGYFLAAPACFVPTAGLCAIFGHCFSPFLHFRGGKGVAAGIGAFLVIAPLPALICIATFVITLLLGRYVSIASILGALSLPVSIALLGNTEPHSKALLASLLAAFLVIARHNANIARLADGSEKKLGDKAA